MNKIYFSGAIGDTLGVTAVLPELSKKINSKIDVYTKFPELFFNNPYVSATNTLNISFTNIQPCLTYDCNIVNYYAQQLMLESGKQYIPELYLTDDEIQTAKNELSEFDNHKKIAVCLYSSADCKDLRYDYIKDLLDRVKQTTNAKLIFFGTKLPDHNDLFDKIVVGTYANGLRHVFALMNECDLYVGVDTGLFHAAAALNIPQVVFFKNNGCSNNKYKNTYYSDSNITCPTACYQQHVSVCHNHCRCMDDFNLSEYFNLIINQING
jgi:ADP-heptose:LPS heptosyltransferase